MYFDINDCTMYFDSFTISDTGCDSSPECNAVLRPSEQILTNAPLEANMTTGKKNDLKMYLLLNSLIFHCHVSLLEGTVAFFELSQFSSHLRSLSPTLHLHLTRPWLHQGVGSW